MKIYESDEHIVLAKKDIKEYLNALIIGGAEDKELFDYLSEEYSYLLQEVEELDLKDDDLVCLSFSPMSGSYLLDMDNLDEVLESIKENVVAHEAELSWAVAHNQPLGHPSPDNPFSKKVIRDLKEKGFEKTYRHYQTIDSKLFLVYRLFRKIFK